MACSFIDAEHNYFEQLVHLSYYQITYFITSQLIRFILAFVHCSAKSGSGISCAIALHTTLHRDDQEFCFN